MQSFLEPLSRPRVIDIAESGLAAIDSWCLKWHMKLIPKMTKSMVASQSRTSASGMVTSLLGVLSLRR